MFLNRVARTSPSYTLLAPLLRATSQGDEVAFAKLHKLTSRKLFGICLQVLREREAADDALQDVFITVWRKAELYDEAKSSPMTWLCTIARNRSLDHAAKRTQLAKGDLELETDFQIAYPSHLADLITEQEGRRAILLLRQLDAKTERVIREAYFGGSSHAQLAERDAIPLGTVKARIRRGLQSLRIRMEA